MKTLDFTIIDNIIINYFSDEALIDEEWDKYTEFFVTNREKHPVLYVISFFYKGPGPNAKQRKSLVNAAGKEALSKTKSIVFTVSKIAKGIITAFNWMAGDTIKAFNPENIDDAFQWAGIDIIYKTKVLKEYDRMKDGLED